MDFAALFALAQSWGPTAISSVLVIVVIYLIKKIDKNGEDDKKRAKDFQDSFENKIQELHDDVYKVLDDHRRENCPTSKQNTSKGKTFIENSAVGKMT